MSRIIDADALLDGYKNMGYDPAEHPEESYMEGWCKGFNAAVDHCMHHVIHAPTIEPERKRGRFVGTEFDGYADGNPVFYEWKCSECGCVFEDEEPMYNFCPNCGADMREGEQDG